MSGFCSENAEKNIIHKRSISEEKELRVRKNLSSEIPPDNSRTQSELNRIIFGFSSKLLGLCREDFQMFPQHRFMQTYCDNFHEVYTEFLRRFSEGSRKIGRNMFEQSPEGAWKISSVNYAERFIRCCSDGYPSKHDHSLDFICTPLVACINQRRKVS